MALHGHGVYPQFESHRWIPTPCSMFPILFPSSYPHCYLQSLPPITNHLLALPHLGNPYLSQSCYSIMSDIFTASIDDVSSNIRYQLTDVLRVVLSSPPSKSDVVLSASWVQALGSAFVAYNA